MRKKRFLSILLSLCMALMLCPVTVFGGVEGTVTFEFAHGTFFGESSPVINYMDAEGGGYIFAA